MVEEAFGVEANSNLLNTFEHHSTQGPYLHRYGRQLYGNDIGPIFGEVCGEIYASEGLVDALDPAYELRPATAFKAG